MILKDNYQNVVIGSHTIDEYKFQIINFMNMLHDNIHKPFDNNCMTADVVIHNLKWYINDILRQEKCEFLDYDKVIFDHITTLKNNLSFMKSFNKKNLKTIIKLNDVIWYELLKNLTKYFNLKYEFNND